MAMLVVRNMSSTRREENRLSSSLLFPTGQLGTRQQWIDGSTTSTKRTVIVFSSNEKGLGMRYWALLSARLYDELRKPIK